MTAVICRRVPVALLVLLGAACSGESAAPNPPPPPPPVAVVTSVDIAPDTVTVFERDTVRLTATPRTATGTSLPGKTVAWTTSAAQVATVSATGLVSAVAPGTATITGTVDGRSGTGQVTVRARIGVDAGARVEKDVRRGGDSLTTTSGGTTYTLLIPPDAIGTPIRIAVTPIVSVRGLPFSGGLLAGVKLEPSGTRFERPLRLRIGRAGPIPTGRTLAGFTMADSGGKAELVPASVVGGEIELIVSHFSVVGATPALPSELAALSPGVDEIGLAADLGRLSAILASGDSEIGMLVRLDRLFGDWFRRIEPDLILSQSTDLSLASGLAEYGYWTASMLFAGETLGDQRTFFETTALVPLVGQANTAIVRGLQEGIRRANAACESTRSLTKARLALFWQEQAEALGLATVVPGSGDRLDRANVIRQLCLRVIPTEVIYPDPATPGASADLQLRFGLKFGADPSLMAPPSVFQLALDLHGTATDGRIDVATDPDGRHRRALVPTGATAFEARVTACFDPVLIEADDVCTTVTVFRGFGRTITGSVIVRTMAGMAGLRDVARITGNLSIEGPIPHLDDLLSLQEIGGNLVIAQLPDLTTLSGLRNLRSVNGVMLTGLPKLESVDGLDNLRAVPGELFVDNLALVPNLQGLAQLTRIGTLRVNRLPLVSSLAGVGGATIERGLDVGSMPLLTSLGGLGSIEPVLEGDVRIGNNPLLLDLGGLANVTTIGGNLAMGGNTRLPTLAFTALTRVGGNLEYFRQPADVVTSFEGLGAGLEVGGDVHIQGPGITSLATLSVRRVGGQVLVNTTLLPDLVSVSLPSLVQVESNRGGWGVAVSPREACSTQPPTLIDLPALTLGSFVFDGGISACLADVRLPALIRNFEGGFFLDVSNVRNLTLGPLKTGAGEVELRGRSTAPTTMATLHLGNIQASTLTVRIIPRLTTLDLSAIDVSRDLIIASLPLLTTITATGRVARQVVFSQVPLMSDSRLIAIGIALGASVVFRDGVRLL